MKTMNENEIIQKVAYQLPGHLCEKLKFSAKTNRRSINEELAFILQEYLSQEYVTWEPWIKKEIEHYSKTKNSSFSWAANHLVASILDQWGTNIPVKH